MVIKNKQADANKVTDVVVILEIFGLYQIVQFSYALLSAMFVNIIGINYVFVAGNINYRCRIPGCDDSRPEFNPPWWPDDNIDRCHQPMLNTTLTGPCTNSSFTGGVERCTEWIYENHNSIIADLNLACQPWKSNLVGTINCFGTMLSMLIAGWMCDRFGRKPTLIICAVSGVIGQFKAFATSYYIYITLEFIEAVFSGGVNAAATVLMMEIAGTNHRLLAGVLYAYAVYLGEFIFALTAMYVQNWQNLVRIVYSPFILFISYIFLIHESPRWQILNGKTEEAKESLALIAKRNKINISHEDLNKLDEIKLKKKFNVNSEVKKEGIKEILYSREIMKRVFVTFTCRFTASFVYYGLMMNSVWLPGNKYTNFILTSLMSFPGELGALYAMNKIGRKQPLILGFIVSGILCIASGYISEGYTWLMITLFLFGKMLIALCYTGAVTYTMELTPTSTRGSLIGVGAFAARVGSMLAPLTPMLLSVSSVLPALLFGISACLTSFALTLTPETKGVPLMDTIEQVDASVRDKKTHSGKANDNCSVDDFEN